MTRLSFGRHSSICAETSSSLRQHPQPPFQGTDGAERKFKASQLNLWHCSTNHSCTQLGQWLVLSWIKSRLLHLWNSPSWLPLSIMSLSPLPHPAVVSVGSDGQDLHPCGCDEHSVFKLSRAAAVKGDCRPVVIENLEPWQSLTYDGLWKQTCCQQQGLLPTVSQHSLLLTSYITNSKWFFIGIIT